MISDGQKHDTQHALTETALYRRFGLAGLRWFCHIYFPMMLALLICVLVALLYASQHLVPPQRSVTYSGSIVLGAVGIVVLVKIWRGYASAVRRLTEELQHGDQQENIAD